MTSTLDRTATPVRRRLRLPSLLLPFAAHAATAPLLIGLLGFLIGVVGAGIPSIWYDEAATINSSQRTWPQLAAEIGTVDLVHALYYAGMHLWFDLVGYSPVTLRLPSAVAIGAAAALLVVFGRVFARPRLGVLAGLVFCLLPRTTWAGTEGRSYALTALLAIAVTVVMTIAVADGRRRWWVLYAALAALSVVVFIYLALVLVAHAATMLWVRGRDRRMPLRRFVLAAGAAAAVGIPFVLATATQRGQVEWLPTIGPRFWSRVFVEQWFFSSEAFALVGWIALLAGAVVLLRRRGVGLSLARLVIPAALLPTTLLVLATAVAVPLYTPRYLTMCLPFVALLIAAALDAVRPRGLTVVALALLVALAIPQIIEQRTPLAKEHTDWGAVAQLLQERRDGDDPDATTAVIFGAVARHPKATARVISYAYPDAFDGTVDITLETSAAESGELWETAVPLTDRLNRVAMSDTVYLLTSTREDATMSTSATLAPRGWRIIDSWRFSEVLVVQYGK